MRGFRLLLLLFALSPVGALAQSASTAPKVEQIKAQLYYSLSGRLSDDIASDPDFMVWNTIIAGGSAEEPATDMLISVRVSGDPNLGVSGPVKLIVKNGRGKIIGQRNVDGQLLGSDGQAWVPLWLRDIGCVGRMNITATMGKSVKTQSIGLPCGE